MQLLKLTEAGDIIWVMFQISADKRVKKQKHDSFEVIKIVENLTKMAVLCGSCRIAFILVLFGLIYQVTM